MRRILLMSLAAIGLAGGVAAADTRVVVDVHGHAQARPAPRTVEVVHYRDQHNRPPMRVERHEARHGFAWVGGEWMWRGREWMWVPGHYVRR